MKKVASLVMVVSFALFLLPVAAFGSVSNGDFEEPVVGHLSGWDIFSSVPGWSILWQSGSGDGADANCEGVLPQLEFHNVNATGWSPQSGSQYVEMDTDCGGPDDGNSGEPANVEISQLIPTIGGATYRLSFYWTPRTGYETSCELELWIDGGFHSSYSGLSPGWQEENVDFTAAPGVTLIAFGEIGLADSFGTFLDNVSVEFVSLFVPVDIKPGSCPNPVNVTDRGGRELNFVVPVAILGTVDFDVTQIDVDTVRLEGLYGPPIRSSLEDVATPYVDNGEDCYDCNDFGPDGYLDLTLKFGAGDVVAALGPVVDGDCVVVELTGALFDGTPFSGQDIVKIINKG